MEVVAAKNLLQQAEAKDPCHLSVRGYGKETQASRWCWCILAALHNRTPAILLLVNTHNFEGVVGRCQFATNCAHCSPASNDALPTVLKPVYGMVDTVYATGGILLLLTPAAQPHRPAQAQTHGKGVAFLIGEACPRQSGFLSTVRPAGGGCTPLATPKTTWQLTQ